MFHAGDLVWAKMSNYPHWPGKIMANGDDMIEICGPLDPRKGEQHYVYFFGTNNYAPIPIKRILPHSQEMFDKHDNNKKISKDFRAAIDEMKEYYHLHVASDLHLNEPVSNDKDPVCDMMSRVKVVTDHSIGNTDHLGGKLILSEVKLVADESEINDVCSETLTPNIVPQQAIEIGVISTSEPSTSKTPTDEHEISLSCDLQTSEVVAEKAIDFSIESSWEPTMPIVVTEHSIEPLTPKVVPGHSTENSDDLSCDLTMSKVKFGTAEYENTDACCEPSSSKIVANKVTDIGVKSSCAPTTSKKVAAENVTDISIRFGWEQTTSKVVAKRAVDSVNDNGFEPTMAQIKRLCATDLPQSKLIGILGLGELGLKFVRKLIETGHDVTVYDDNLDLTNMLYINGATVANSVKDICARCELIFGCTFANGSRDKLFVQDILSFIAKNKDLKGYIEMTPMDETDLIGAADIVDYVKVPFLELAVGAPWFLENGVLNFLAAGSKNVFIECLPIFRKLSNVDAIYMGNKIGQAFATDQMFNALIVSLSASFQEVLDFAAAKNIPRNQIRELFDFAEINSALINQKIDGVKKTFNNTTALDYLEEDMQRVQTMGHELCQSMPIIDSSFISFIHARYNSNN